MRILTLTLLLAVLSGSAFATANKKQVKLRVQAPSGNLDEATMYFDQGINPTYNYQEDAQKVLSGVAGVPVIYSVTADNIDCSINGFGTLSSTEVVPVGLDVDANGTYTITAPLLDNFDPTSIIRLEDRQAGVFTDLRTNFYLAQVTDNEPASGRFFLHVSYPSAVSHVAAGCANNDGKLLVETDNSIVWDHCNLFDSFGNAVGAKNNVTGSFDFRMLPEGDYYMAFTYGSYTTTQPFHVNGNSVVADVSATAVNVATFEDVTFSAIATNTNQYEWDFGDGTLIVGVAHPTLSYYTPGTYTVNLKCSNSQGCYDNAQITINVTLASGVQEINANQIDVIAQGKDVVVEMTAAPEKSAGIQIYNLIGQSVYSNNLTTQKSTISLATQPVGYYLVSVQNADKVSTKRVFIGK
ncbi:MAG: PKD domain-containing protein [Chitinophagales bacterium]